MTPRTWFISDTHFGHANIIGHQPIQRGHFPTADAMDEAMIDRWNFLVNKNDTVYHVGDFGWKVSQSVEILKRLNGKKILIPGNHDKKEIKNQEFTKHFQLIAPYSYLELDIEGVRVVFSHFPIWEWNQIHRGAIHLHGHLHGKPHGIPGKILDVGADNQDLAPISMEEVMAIMNTLPLRDHH